MRWEQDYHLFVLGLLSFAAATLGRTLAVDAGVAGPLCTSSAWVSYVLLIVAFYVDNGRNLPIWRELPPAAY